MYSTLTVADNTKVKKYCKELIHGNFFCRENPKTKGGYRDIVHFFDEISNRLDAVGYELIKSDDFQTVYLSEQPDMPSSTFNLGISRSRVLLMLLKKYMGGIRDVNVSSTIYYNWNELLKDMQDVSTSSRDKNDIIDALWFFKKMHIIDVNANKKLLKENDENDEIAISIYPSIRCICALDKLAEVEERLQTYQSVAVQESDMTTNQETTSDDVDDEE